MLAELFRRKSINQAEQSKRNVFLRSKAENAAKVLEGLPFVRKIILTGSVAQNRATIQSDIDIIVTYDPDGYNSAYDEKGVSPIRIILKGAEFKLGNIPDAIDVFLEIPHDDLVRFLETGRNPYYNTNVKRLREDSKHWITLFKR